MRRHCLAVCDRGVPDHHELLAVGCHIVDGDTPYAGSETAFKKSPGSPRSKLGFRLDVHSHHLLAVQVEQLLPVSRPVGLGLAPNVPQSGVISQVLIGSLNSSVTLPTLDPWLGSRNRCVFSRSSSRRGLLFRVCSWESAIVLTILYVQRWIDERF